MARGAIRMTPERAGRSRHLGRGYRRCRLVKEEEAAGFRRRRSNAVVTAPSTPTAKTGMEPYSMTLLGSIACSTASLGTLSDLSAALIVRALGCVGATDRASFG